MNKLLLTGADGQLGQTFQTHFPSSDLSQKYRLLTADIQEMDLTKEKSISDFLQSNIPSLIVNCGAYTSVDTAESEVEAARKINDGAVSCIARWASENNCRMIHISTDFVFDGRKREPYSPFDETNPLGIYGETKLAGESHLLKLLPKDGVVLRASWLYSEHGHNFVKTMIELMNRKSELGVVNDQIGSPTSTHSLVRVLLSLIEHCTISGVLHWCDGAAISWYDFAIEIQRQAYKHGLLEREIPIKPLTTEEYPTPAVRPRYSVLHRGTTLEKLSLHVTNWQAELKAVVLQIKALNEASDE